MNTMQAVSFSNVFHTSIGFVTLQTIMFELVWILDLVSPLLDFVQELPEHRPSEVVWQSAGPVVFDEGFNDSLSEGGNGIY